MLRAAPRSYWQNGVVGQLAAAVIRGDRLNYAEVRSAGCGTASERDTVIAGNVGLKWVCPAFHPTSCLLRCAPPMPAGLCRAGVLHLRQGRHGSPAALRQVPHSELLQRKVPAAELGPPQEGAPKGRQLLLLPQCLPTLPFAWHGLTGWRHPLTVLTF